MVAMGFQDETKLAVLPQLDIRELKNAERDLFKANATNKIEALRKALTGAVRLHGDRNNLRWSKADKYLLIELSKAGYKNEHIAYILGRHVMGVESKRQEMGLTKINVEKAAAASAGQRDMFSDAELRSKYPANVEGSVDFKAANDNDILEEKVTKLKKFVSDLFDEPVGVMVWKL